MSLLNILHVYYNRQVHVHVYMHTCTCIIHVDVVDIVCVFAHNDLIIYTECKA